MKRRLLMIASLLCALAAGPGQVRADDAPQGAIPYKVEKESTGKLAYQSLAALLVVAVAGYGIVLGLKRFGGRIGGPLRASTRVRTVESTRLSARSTLHVVQYNGQELLLAESGNGVALLSSRALAAAASRSGDTDE